MHLPRAAPSESQDPCPVGVHTRLAWGLLAGGLPRLPRAPPAGPAALTKHHDPCGLNGRNVLSQSHFLLAGRGPPSAASPRSHPSVQGPRVSRVASLPAQDTGCGSGPTHSLLELPDSLIMNYDYHSHGILLLFTVDIIIIHSHWTGTFFFLH